MCGRFTNRYRCRELVELYRITEPYITPISNMEPRYNFAPTQTGVVVRLDKDGRCQPVMTRWGLVPSWSKDDKGCARMINARAETVTEKPSYKMPFCVSGVSPTGSSNGRSLRRRRSSPISSRRRSRSHSPSPACGSGGIRVTGARFSRRSQSSRPNRTHFAPPFTTACRSCRRRNHGRHGWVRRTPRRAIYGSSLGRFRLIAWSAGRWGRR